MRNLYGSEVDEIEKSPRARGRNCGHRVPQILLVLLPPLRPPLHPPLLSFPWRETKQITNVHPHVRTHSTHSEQLWLALPTSTLN